MIGQSSDREILSWGLVHPAHDPTAIENSSVEGAADHLYLHRVAHIAASRAQAQGLFELAERLTERRESYEARFRSMDEILSHVLHCGRNVRLMKGMAVTQWYGALKRDVGDLDVWVEELDDAFCLADHLVGIGYLYSPEEPPWLKRDELGKLYGQVRMVDEGFRRISVDIHAGPYSVRYGGVLRFGEASALPNGGAFTVNDSVCAALGNSAGDCTINAKLLNDVHLAAEIGFDHEYVAAALAHAEIGPFTATVARNVLELCQTSASAASLLSGLAEQCAPEYVALSHTADARQRAELVAAHTFRLGVRQGGDVAYCERLAGEAFRAYQRATSLHVSSEHEAVDFTALDPFTCVRMIPEDQLSKDVYNAITGRELTSKTTISDALSLLTYGDVNVVVHGEDRFLATVDYTVAAPPASLETSGP